MSLVTRTYMWRQSGYGLYGPNSQQNPTSGDASQMQQPSGPDRARKSAEPQPGAKRKRSAEPQPAAPSWQGGSAQATPHSTEEGENNPKNKRRASEVTVVCCSDIVACDCMLYAQRPLPRGMERLQSCPTPHAVDFSFLCLECDTVSRRSYNRDPSFW